MGRETDDRGAPGTLLHLVTLICRDEEHATRCIAALAEHGRPDALAFGCVSYEFGRKAGSPETVWLVERWRRWVDLDALLEARVVPALPLYNPLLARPFDPARDTVRIALTNT